MRSALLALCLIACAPETPTPGTPEPVVVADPPQAVPAALPAIQGEWRLSEMNGRSAGDSLGEAGVPTPITLSVGEFSLRAQSQCIAFWHRYDWRDGRVVLSSLGPHVMCARGLTSWETEFSRSLSAITDATITDGALQLTGPAAQLRFQPLPPVPVQRFTGRWRLRFVHGAPLPAGETLEITVTEDRITANACVFSSWRYRQDGPLLEVTPLPGAVCERTLTEFEQQFSRFMAGLNRATIIQGGALILDSPSAQLEFRRAD